MDSANIFLTSIKHKIPSNAGSALQPILEQAGEQSLHKSAHQSRVQGHRRADPT